jgi:OmcA/MtrC family decaheme c-type cytochrome
MVCGLLATGAFMGGCSGDDGADGAQGPAGPAGPEGPAGPPGTGVLPISKVVPESCSTCHDRQGEAHQAIYDRYTDGSTLLMTITSVSSAPVGGPAPYTVTVTFEIRKNGVLTDFGNALSGIDTKSFYAVQYNSATRQYLGYKSLLTSGAANIISNGNGTYSLTQTGVAFAPEAPADGAQVYGYIADGILLTQAGDADEDIELPPGTHVTLYDDESNAARAFGTAAAGNYLSAANVGVKDTATGHITTPGCVSCHGSPYLKHGYRAAQVAGLPDFGACKSCHADDRAGGSGGRGWQQMVDDPAAWAAGDPTPASYAYNASLMNVTHMSHAMEFPFPMTMANCVTCHEGKLTQVLADANFKPVTCMSCHPVTGTDTWGFEKPSSEREVYWQPNRAPALLELITDAGALAVHDLTRVTRDAANEAYCATCHVPQGATPAIAPRFSQFHSGYDAKIYNASGQKYRDLYTVSVSSVTKTGNVLDIRFTSTNTDVVPMVTVSFYGYDAKDFYLSCHTRDDNGNRMEKTIGVANPLFTEEADSVAGNWHVKLDLAAFSEADFEGGIPALIASGKVRQAEVAVLPSLTVGDRTVALNAPSKTVDVSADGVDKFVANYYQGTGALVDEAKCNACHDALATTFHTASTADVVGAGNRGGNIVVCRTCHVVTSGGSHLEMQSRSIDSYVHAIHSFQDFDIGDIDFTDAVEAKRYEEHIQHVFPNFTIRNCEGCHVGPDVGGNVVYNVPDQRKSMPGQLSASDTTSLERTIGNVPAYVTGPASRACGSCHRARLINDDLASDLVSLNQHIANNGYMVDDTSILYEAIDKIMGLFE